MGASELALTPVPRRDFRHKILAADSIGIEATEQIARRGCLMVRARYLRHRRCLGRGRAVEAVNEGFATAVTEHLERYSSAPSPYSVKIRENVDALGFV